MALPEQYLVSTKNLDTFFNSLLNAQTPARFTNNFLEQLEFKSTNDRLFIGILKALKFLDQNNVPQDRYFRFLDQTQSRQVLAEAIRDAYSDLFAVNKKANELSTSEVKNKLKTLLQGSKSDAVLNWMANTFTSLCKYADFSIAHNTGMAPIRRDTNQGEEVPNDNENNRMTHELISKKITTEMHYNIQIHLPETRDTMVYDAIFKSLKDHLL
ncbi:MAG: hypothetical protein JWQ09_1093 [Segetibacter sp.]|nr:hypothetical protein [Segetibacter sp.]